MPVSLQPRAPRLCRIIRADDKRPVRVSARGYHVRPYGHYQVELGVADETDQPSTVTVVSGPARRTNDQEERVTQDGRLLRRIDFQVTRDDEGTRFWWSRLEPLILRLQYTDGRDDYEQRCWLVVRPRRLWALWALVSSAILYGVIPWLSRTILQQGDLSDAWSQVFETLSRPAVWQGLMLVILGAWLMIVLSDRLQLGLRWRQLRSDVRRDVGHYRQLTERRTT